MSPPPSRRPLVAVQHAYPSDPRRDVATVLERAARSVEDGGVAVLPEYFYKPPGRPPSPETVEELGWIQDAILEATEDIDGALVATVPEATDEALYNTAIAAEGGELKLEQRKVRPTDKERSAGVRPYKGLRVAEVQGLRLGILVCADVLALDLLEAMRALEPDVVAVPVLSPNREADITRSARTSVFIARAWDLGAYVVKAGGFHEPEVVGRSLITAPWGLLAQAPGDYERALLSAPFDVGKLGQARDPFVGLGDA